MSLVVLILHHGLGVRWVDNLCLLFQKTSAGLLAHVLRERHPMCGRLVCLLLVAGFPGEE